VIAGVVAQAAGLFAVTNSGGWNLSRA